MFVKVNKVGGRIDVDFGVYVASPMVNAQYTSYNANDIDEVWLYDDLSAVGVKMNTRSEWKLCTGGCPDAFTVELVDGVAPTDNTDLYMKIRNMIP